jgi:enoyl-CoA hydratase
MTQDYETLSVTLKNRVALIELNRVDKANAMNAPMWRELEESFKWADSEPQVRVVVLAARGKHFCSGIDLGMFSDLIESKYEPARKAEQLRMIIKNLQGNLTAIESCRKPVLAAIHSSCIGGGVDMISCCDMRYCTEDAFFSIKEIDIGMTADVGTLQRLPKLISDGMTRELAYTGRKMDACEALRTGLVNHVYETQQQMLDAVLEIAADIASKSPLAIRGTKEMLLYSRDHSVADGLNYIATWNAGMLSMDDVLKSMEAQMKNKTAEYDD